MLNLIHARTFLSVVENGGVRAAARALEISPSSVVDHINQLETELGVGLVTRGHGSAKLTLQGERFLPYARSLIGTAQRAKELILSPMVRVAAASNVGIYLLQEPLAAARRETGIDTELWIGPNPVVAERLTLGCADIAVMEWWDGRDGFRAIAWRQEPLVVIVSPEHPWAQRCMISAEDLAKDTLLGGEAGSGTGTLLRQKLGPIANSLKTISGLGSTEAVKRAVRAGQGISIVLSSAVQDEILHGHLVALKISEIELVKEVYLIVPEHAERSSALSRLLGSLIRHSRL